MRVAGDAGADRTVTPGPYATGAGLVHEETVPLTTINVGS